jgi:protease stability complex PrcB-like protein
VPRVVALTLCLGLLATACASSPGGSPEKERLSFRTLAQAAPGGGGAEHAVVLVATDSKSLEAIDRLIAPRDRFATAEAELSSEVVIGVFAGTVSTGGRAVAIDDMALEGKRIRIRATLSVPQPDAVGTQALTHPYHVIALSRNGLPLPPRVSWVLREEGGPIIARGETP